MQLKWQYVLGKKDIWIRETEDMEQHAEMTYLLLSSIFYSLGISPCCPAPKLKQSGKQEL